MSDCSEIGHCLILGMDKDGNILYGCNRGCGDVTPLKDLIDDPHLLAEISEAIHENKRLKEGIQKINMARRNVLKMVAKAHKHGYTLSPPEIEEIKNTLTLTGWDNEVEP